VYFLIDPLIDISSFILSWPLVDGFVVAVLGTYCLFRIVDRTLDRGWKIKLGSAMRYSQRKDLHEVLIMSAMEIVQRVFGKRHLSFRCLVASFVYSVIVFPVLAVTGLFTSLIAASQFWIGTLEQEDALLTIIGSLLASWFINFIAILKTRRLIGISLLVSKGLMTIGGAETRTYFHLAVIVIGIFDLFFSYEIYMMILGVADWLLTDSYTWWLAGLQLWNPQILSHILRLEPLDGLFFWAAMIPSLWFYIYLGASHLFSAPLRFGRPFGSRRHRLDSHGQSVRSIGIIATGLVGAFILLIDLTSPLARLRAIYYLSKQASDQRCNLIDRRQVYELLREDIIHKLYPERKVTPEISLRELEAKDVASPKDHPGAGGGETREPNFFDDDPTLDDLPNFQTIWGGFFDVKLDDSFSARPIGHLAEQIFKARCVARNEGKPSPDINDPTRRIQLKYER
jgi:hypothetical protein